MTHPPPAFDGETSSLWEAIWPPTDTQLAFVNAPQQRHARTLRYWPGKLSVASLQSAIDSVVSRHSLLRTAYVRHRRPWGVTLKALRVPVLVVDLSGIDSTTREAHARQIARELVFRPFAFATGPLLRIAVIRLSSDDQVLVFSVDHSLFDAWSSAILARELTAFYQSASAERDGILAPLPRQFHEFAAEQRRWLESGDAEPHLDYWRKTVAGAVSPGWLPVDEGCSSDLVDLDLPPTRGRVDADAHTALQQFARRQKSTLFVVLATAFSVLLARWSRRDDIFMFIVHWGRTREDLRDLMGPFFDVWLLRTAIRREASFSELFQSVKDIHREAQHHTCVPGSRIRATLDDAATERVYPTTIFNFLPQLPAPSHEGPVKRTPNWIPNSGRFDGARHAIGIGIWTTEHGIHWEIGHSAALFRVETIEKMSRGLEELLVRIARDPDVPLAQLLQVDPSFRLNESGSVVPTC